MSAHDRHQLDRPDETRLQEVRTRLIERRAKQVRTLLERVGDGDDDPLAVGEQVRQVVGEEVADGDRKQAGARARHTDEAGDGQRRRDDQSQEGKQLERRDGRRRRAEDLEPGCGLRQPVEQDRARADRDQHDVFPSPAGLEQACWERPPSESTRFVDQREQREPADEPEPHPERLAVRAPGVAAELGHHRQGQRRIADERDEQRPTDCPLEDELEPDDEHKSDESRPVAEPLRILRRVPALETDATKDPGADVVER